MLLERLKRKFVGVLPILLGAVIFALLLTLVTLLISPLLPESAQTFLRQLQSADWEGSRASMHQFFAGFGPQMPYVFIGAQVLQVIFAPIPGQFVGLLGGYLFGFWHGLFLTMVGLAIGSWIAMTLGRVLGERLVRRVVPAALMEKFDFLVTRGGIANFFLLFLLPALPDDAICFMAGLTRFRIAKLLAVCLIGRLPGMAVLTFVGSSVGAPSPYTTLVLVVAVIGAVSLWFFSEDIEAAFLRHYRS